MNNYLHVVTPLERISELVDDRLFKLRQSPKMTTEKRLLSKIELIIHEENERNKSVTMTDSNTRDYIVGTLNIS